MVLRIAALTSRNLLTVETTQRLTTQSSFHLDAMRDLRFLKAREKAIRRSYGRIAIEIGHLFSKLDSTWSYP